ncbi:MAG: hypothetical protein M1839_008551 [Geoglossum umbratile]|nr:MAG: hypothetical protein M1839_008551 [Geoglossum umbratile]
MVGIAGGVPSAQADVRLGDVVISQPNSQNGGVVQYDFGKIGLGGCLTRTGFLNAPPTILLSALATFQSSRLTRQSDFSVHLSELISRQEGFSSEKAGLDVLFERDYHHIGEQTCDQCSRDRVVERSSRSRQEPFVHYGTIASGNVVMKDGVTRDSWSKELGGVLCFEMEAAGLMNSFPCLVIRGICDYADSHKNKKWQPYAAATAAACTKDFLSFIPSAKAVMAGINLAPGEDQNGQCLRDLRLTDPRDDKKRIEASKDILLQDCCTWIFQDPNFLGWSDNRDARLLWIKGDPGKGKTMMMIALIDELSKDLKHGSCVLSYFFCQSTNSRLNNAVAVLRGLIYLLVVKQTTLIRHLRKRYDTAGVQLFEGPNTLYALSAILSDMLNDSRLERVYLMVDALDECDSGLLQLLDVIAPRKPEPSSKVKWLVASRNRPDIEERLRPDSFLLKISLELNPSPISSAVNNFIDTKVSELANRKKYDNRLCKEVRSYLSKNAEDTFLWVALVCRELRDVPSWEAQSVLEEFPPGLEPLYDRMMSQIQQGKSERRVQLCKQVLTTVTLAFRPMHLKELAATADLSKIFSSDLRSINELVELSGSFLTVRGDTVYFIHQSAKDYFGTGKGSLKIFSSNQIVKHLEIACRSLKLMSGTLKRDICGLKMPSALLSKVKCINQDPLVHIRYACCYWVDHLHISYLQRDQVRRYSSDQVHKFLKEHFLHWLEALSLMGKMSEGVLMITTLQSMLTPDNHMELYALVCDARRFILSHRLVIEMAPLQVYNSALVFSPVKSIIRDIFSDQIPTWIKSLPMAEKIWSPSLQTLEGHSDLVNAVAFSPDSQFLASGSYDKTVRLWDLATGATVQTLEGHSGSVHAVAFSPDSQLLASGSYDEVRLWDPATGAIVQTLEDVSGPLGKVSFSPDSQLLVSTDRSSTTRLWDTTTGILRGAIEGHSAIFSPDGGQLASISDGKVMLRDSITGLLCRILECHSPWISALAFTPNSHFLACAGYSKIQLWDVTNGVLCRTLEGHSSWIETLFYSLDGKILMSASQDYTIRIWDPTTGVCRGSVDCQSRLVSAATVSPDGRILATPNIMSVGVWDALTGALCNNLAGHSEYITTVAFSPNGQFIGSASADKTVRLWDATTAASPGTGGGDSGLVVELEFSPDSQHLATVSVLDKAIRLWDAKNGALRATLKNHSDLVTTVTFSPDSRILASASRDKTVKLWEARTGACRSSLEGHSSSVNSIDFSPDGQLLASGSSDSRVKLWDPGTGALCATLEGHSRYIRSVVFSRDGRLLASVSDDNTVRLWDPVLKTCLGTLTGPSRMIYNVTFSGDGQFLACNSDNCAVRVWDTKNGACRGTFIQSKHTGAVAFSPDGQLLACAVYDNTVILRNIRTGGVVQVLPAVGRIHKLSFSSDGSHLKTNRGLLELWRASSSGDQPLSNTLCYLYVEEDWVTWKTKKVLRLPPDYRPRCLAVQENIIAFAHASGQVVILEFRPSIMTREYDTEC